MINKYARIKVYMVLRWYACAQVFYYSTGIFLEANIPEHMVQYANIGTGVINVAMTAISVRFFCLDLIFLG